MQFQQQCIFRPGSFPDMAPAQSAWQQYNLNKSISCTLGAVLNCLSRMHSPPSSLPIATYRVERGTGNARKLYSHAHGKWPSGEFPNIR